jgi:hypothetical protein
MMVYFAENKFSVVQGRKFTCFENKTQYSVAVMNTHVFLSLVPPLLCSFY